MIRPTLKFVRALTAIVRDRRGITIVEFALVSPVLLLFIMGVLDMGHTLYVRSALDGEMLKAGRNSALESAGTTTAQDALDETVRQQIRRIAGTGADVTFTRKAFRDYKSAQNVAEPFIDSNHDGICNNGESYEDLNNNNMRDLDGGRTGQGNARDAVVYTANVSYQRMFPMAAMIGWPQRVTLSATTTLRNQPYGDQAPVATRACP